MRVVVDTNIAFSAILNTNSTIARILLQPKSNLHFSSKIRFIDANLIPSNILIKTQDLIKDIDIDDTEFVALTNHIHGKLWSGDKILQNGLIQRGWIKFISTSELFQLINKKR
jgi:predicted nucleic acid-binding protein